MPDRKRPREPLHGQGADSVDVVIVGAGFAGLTMLHRVRRLVLSTRVLGAAFADDAVYSIIGVRLGRFDVSAGLRRLAARLRQTSVMSPDLIQ